MKNLFLICSLLTLGAHAAIWSDPERGDGRATGNSRSGDDVNLLTNSARRLDGGSEYGDGRVTGNSFGSTIEDTYLFYAKKLELSQNETKIRNREDSNIPSKSSSVIDTKKILDFINNGGIEAVDAHSNRIGRYEVSRVSNGKLLVNIQMYQSEVSQAADMEYRIQVQLLEATGQLNKVDELN